MSREPTTHAVEILDRIFGDDPELTSLLEEERVHARIARQIYALRAERGLTQRELAKCVGTTQSAIARLEDADYEGHSVRMLRKIASALGARLDVYLVPTDG